MGSDPSFDEMQSVVVGKVNQTKKYRRPSACAGSGGITTVIKIL